MKRIFFFAKTLIILSAVTGESTQEVSTQVVAVVQPHFAFLGALQTRGEEMSTSGHSKTFSLAYGTRSNMSRLGHPSS